MCFTLFNSIRNRKLHCNCFLFPGSLYFKNSAILCVKFYFSHIFPIFSVLSVPDSDFLPHITRSGRRSSGFSVPVHACTGITTRFVSQPSAVKVTVISPASYPARTTAITYTVFHQRRLLPAAAVSDGSRAVLHHPDPLRIRRPGISVFQALAYHEIEPRQMYAGGTVSSAAL